MLLRCCKGVHNGPESLEGGGEASVGGGDEENANIAEQC